MAWFKRRIEVLLSVEADDEEDAEYIMSETWSSSQMRGASVELWPDKNVPDTWVKEDED